MIPNYTLLPLPNNVTLPLELFLSVVTIFEDCNLESSTTGPILTQRIDFLTDGLLRLYNNYITPLIKVIDMTEERGVLSAEVLSSVVRSLSVLNSLAMKLDLDDALLRGSIGLRLSLLLSDFVQDKHQALSVLRSTINYADSVREELINPGIHKPVYIDDISALSRASVTLFVDDFSHMEAKKRLGASAYAGQGVFGTASQLDPLIQAIAAMQVDLSYTLFRIELSLGKEVKGKHERHVGKLRKRKERERLAASSVEKSASRKGKMSATKRGTMSATTVGGGNTTSNGETIMLTTIAANSSDIGVQFDPQTESRLQIECRKNNYLKALLQIEMSTYRTNDPDEIEALLKDTVGLLNEAKAKEDALLENISKIRENDENGGVTKGRNPPPPLLLARSHMSITLVPQPFTLTDPTNNSKIHHLKLYGKPSGAGTDVSINNTEFPGTGVSLPYDHRSHTSNPVTVTGLPENDSYVFAIAAFDENDEILGNIGGTSQPVEALNPLNLQLCWSYLSQKALEMGQPAIAAEAAFSVIGDVVSHGAEVRASDLSLGWSAKPMNSLNLKPSIVDRLPDSVLQAFVKSVCFYVDGMKRVSDERDEEEKGGGLLKTQVNLLKTARMMELGCVVSAIANDAELLKETVWRCYHILLPVLKLKQTASYVQPCLLHLQQSMLLLPRPLWDEAIHKVFSSISYQITRNGGVMAEVQAVKFALLNNPTNEEETDKLQGIEITANSPERDINAVTSEQIALFDVWQSVGIYAKLGSELLSGAAAIPPSLLNEDVVEGDDETEGVPRGSLVINHLVGSKLGSDPIGAMQLLKEDFPDDEAFVRYFCMVCSSCLMGGKVNFVEKALREFVWARSKLLPFCVAVLDKEKEGSHYLKEAEEGNDQTESSEKKDQTNTDLNSTIGGDNNSLAGSIVFGDEQNISDTAPNSDEKFQLMLLSSIEQIRGICDISNALKFGNLWSAKNSTQKKLKIFGNAAGLTNLIKTMTPEFSDGVESDLSLELEDFNIEEDNDEVEKELEEVISHR